MDSLFLDFSSYSFFFTASVDIFAHCQKLHIHVAPGKKKNEKENRSGAMELKTLDIRLSLSVCVCVFVCVYTHNIFRLTALIGVGLALLRHAGQCLAGDGVIVRTGRVHFDGRRFAWLICSFRHCMRQCKRERGMVREREAAQNKKER